MSLGLEAESADTFFRPVDPTGAHNVQLTFQYDVTGKSPAISSRTIATREHW